MRGRWTKARKSIECGRCNYPIARGEVILKVRSFTESPPAFLCTGPERCAFIVLNGVFNHLGNLIKEMNDMATNEVPIGKFDPDLQMIRQDLSPDGPNFAYLKEMKQRNNWQQDLWRMTSLEAPAEPENQQQTSFAVYGDAPDPRIGPSPLDRC